MSESVEGADIPTPEEHAAVERTLGMLDGLADLWSAKNNIEDQIRRMLGVAASPAWIALMLRWTKHAYVEGAADGCQSAKTEIDALRAEIDALTRDEGEE